MQVKCSRKELYEAVQLVGQAVSGRSTLPILTHILLDATGDGLRLMASDTEVWVDRTIPAGIGTNGSATVPAKMIAEILSTLPDGDVTLETGERYAVQLKAGVSSYKLQGLVPDEYPTVPQLEEATRFTLPGELLRDMIKQVSFAVSKDETRAVLTGLLMSYDGETLRLVATDTHRLAVREAQVKAESGADVNVSAIVPERAISLLSRVPGNEESQVTLAFGANRASFEVQGAKLVTQLIEGQFPNYQRVIPSSHTRRWVIVGDELNRAVRRASIVGKENSNRVILQTEGEKLVISARSDIGEAHEEIDVAREGDDLEVAFNAKYIMDVIAVMETEGIALEMTENLRPVLLKPISENGDYQCVIMPMALS